VELTSDDVGDVSALPDLLDQIEDPVGSVTPDGAYDGGGTYDEVLQRHPEARVIIPPRSTAVLSEAGTTQRNDHLRSIEQHGRLGWQCRSAYGRRSLVETAMYRYKAIIGRRLHARRLLNQRIEAKVGCNVLNRMTSPGMSVSIRVKQSERRKEKGRSRYSCTNVHLNACIVAFERRSVGTILVDRDLLGRPAPLDRLTHKPQRGFAISLTDQARRFAESGDPNWPGCFDKPWFQRLDTQVGQNDAAVAVSGPRQTKCRKSKFWRRCHATRWKRVRSVVAFHRPYVAGATD
jgi:hypothetical protein